ncbi:DoxX family membrane protein [Aureivirga sp. CE67]|uniref:DoxX family membrane protein n=1 Tax=Aureivirga sp. CE67 TaxID=1788983 RepID=UPI0018CA3739|nr:DoxX family membrane protein [Aureivirga sp. CE67]
MDLIKENITEILILVFLIITFVQSGIDKILDWKGNVSFITDHFKLSPLRNMVPLLLGIVMIIETIAGVLMIAGIYQLSTSGATDMALYGAVLSAVTLIFLLIGQRLAKDYPGAMSLTVYFILNVMVIYMLTH